MKKREKTINLKKEKKVMNNIKQVTNLLVTYGKKLSFDMGYRGK